MLRHAIHDKPMNPIAGPWVSTAECLQNDKGFIQFQGPFNGPLQAEIPFDPAVSGHPIKDIVAVTLDFCIIDFSNTNFWDTIGHATISLD